MLDFFIRNAWAQEAPPQGGGFSLLLMMIIFFAFMYFFMIRPQMKQAKEHKKMVEELARGDEVVTGGGMLGKITQVGDNFIVIEIAQNIEVKVQKHSISTTLPKGTLKTL